MSEPVTNIEIEDVLSSIRRLVSDDGRNRITAEPERAPEKLVLTPALRVDDTVVEDTVEETVAEPDPTVDKILDAIAQSTERPDDAQILEVQEDTFEGPLEARFADIEAETSEDLTDEETAQDDQHEVAEVQDAAHDVHSDEHAHHDVAEQEPQDDQAQDFADDAAAQNPEQSDVLSWEDHIDEDDDHETWIDEDEIEDAEMSEAEIAQAQPQEHASVAAQDHDEAGHDQMAHEDTGGVDLFGGDDTVLDEETLRELVADIVRQELQGALGERITRNVRKLVRREIHRALSSQEFD